MNLPDLKEHIPEHFNGSARTWIYQSSRLFTISEAFEIETILNQFISGWTSHGDKVEGYANLFYGRFIVIIANEDQVKVSGCSTDSSVEIIRKIEKTFAVSMFDRQLLAFLMENGKVEYVPFSQVQYAYNAGLIKDETQFFNNVVLTKDDLLQNWIVPLKDSWLYKRITVN